VDLPEEEEDTCGGILIVLSFVCYFQRRRRIPGEGY
jgi:hypothetical protein